MIKNPYGWCPNYAEVTFCTNSHVDKLALQFSQGQRNPVNDFYLTKITIELKPFDSDNCGNLYGSIFLKRR